MAIAFLPRVARTVFVLSAHSLVWCFSASACAEDDRGHCPNEVHDSPTGPSMALLQSQRHLQRQGAQVQSEIRRRGSAPCSCEAEGSHWKPAAPRAPRCLFIDLGAADGNTFRSFLSDGYGPVKDCPSGGSYEAILVEANPIFNQRLMEVERNHTESVRVLPASAAYMCEGVTNFFLDTVDTEQNFWGSSLSSDAWDVVRSGKSQVTVPLVNVARLITESALPDDYVIVKMDIEGAEWDIVPCLAKSKLVAQLIDALYIERHPGEWSLVGTDETSYQNAIIELNQLGVNTPPYNSPSL